MITSFFTVTFALVHGVGLVLMALWFVYEHWKFRKDMAPIGIKLTHSSISLAFITFVTNGLQASYVALQKLSSFVLRTLTTCGAKITRKKDDDLNPTGVFLSTPEKIDIEIEPPTQAPSRQETIHGEESSPVPLDILEEALGEILAREEDSNENGNTGRGPALILDMGIVEEPDTIEPHESLSAAQPPSPLTQLLNLRLTFGAFTTQR